jgi:hypothetical protein
VQADEQPARRRARWIAAAGALLSAVLLTSLPAEATSASRQQVPIDQTFPAPVLSRACGFQITGHLEGTMTVTDFTDSDGTFLREVTPFRLTQIFAANNQVITGHTSQHIATAIQRDGTFTVAFTGNDSLFTLPGSGPVIGSAGRLVMLFSADNELLDISQETGPTFADPTAVCSALAP